MHHLPDDLAAHAEHLLDGTGLSIEQVLHIASSAESSDDELQRAAVAALRSGWASPDISVTQPDPAPEPAQEPEPQP